MSRVCPLFVVIQDIAEEFVPEKYKSSGKGSFQHAGRQALVESSQPLTPSHLEHTVQEPFVGLHLSKGDSCLLKAIHLHSLLKKVKRISKSFTDDPRTASTCQIMHVTRADVGPFGDTVKDVVRGKLEPSIWENSYNGGSEATII